MRVPAPHTSHDLGRGCHPPQPQCPLPRAQSSRRLGKLLGNEREDTLARALHPGSPFARQLFSNTTTPPSRVAGPAQLLGPLSAGLQCQSATVVLLTRLGGREDRGEVRTVRNRGWAPSWPRKFNQIRDKGLPWK